MKPFAHKKLLTLIENTLDDLFPNPQISLNYTNHYTLLIAVLLSAQCTDLRVNQITPILFGNGTTPEAIYKMSVEEIQNIIRPCGLSKKKAEAIHTLSGILIRQYKSKIPNSLEALETLPGVGHKTASVVASQALNIPAFPVDTHIHRCAFRWQLTSGKNVLETEATLKGLFPKKDWKIRHLQIIFYGRTYCPARGHISHLCPICHFIYNKK